MGSKSRRHHLVPRFYLRRFANPKEQVFAFRRTAGKGFTTSIDNAPVETGFYSVDDEFGDSSEMVEGMLGKIEAINADILHRVDTDDSTLTDDERVSLSHLLALQFTRTRDFRNTSVGLADFLVRAQAGLIFGGVERDRWRDAYQETTGRDISEAEVVQLANFAAGEGEYTFMPPRNELVAHMLKLTSDIAPAFFARSWHIIKSEERAFATSDRPVVLWSRPDPQRLGLGIGVATADEIYFPLDSRKVLVLTREDVGWPSVVLATSRMIKQTNVIIAHAAHEWLFHHPKHDPLKGIYISKEPTASMSVNGAPFGSARMRDELDKIHRMGAALKRNRATNLGESKSHEDD